MGFLEEVIMGKRRPQKPKEEPVSVVLSQKCGESFRVEFEGPTTGDNAAVLAAIAALGVKLDGQIAMLAALIEASGGGGGAETQARIDAVADGLDDVQKTIEE